MSTKVWNVGDVLTAADMNTWTVPLAAVKPSDTGRASNTTITNDPDLQVSVLASATYRILAVIQYKGGANGASDGNVTINVPAGATGFFIAQRHQISSLTFESIVGPFGGGLNIGTSGTGNIHPLTLMGTVVTSGAGTVAVAWSQNTSNGTATTFMAGSLLELQRIA